jgi:hypothetical protein
MCDCTMPGDCSARSGVGWYRVSIQGRNSLTHLTMPKQETVAAGPPPGERAAEKNERNSLTWRANNFLPRAHALSTRMHARWPKWPWPMDDTPEPTTAAGGGPALLLLLLLFGAVLLSPATLVCAAALSERAQQRFRRRRRRRRCVCACERSAQRASSPACARGCSRPSRARGRRSRLCLKNRRSAPARASSRRRAKPFSQCSSARGLGRPPSRQAGETRARAHSPSASMAEFYKYPQRLAARSAHRHAAEVHQFIFVAAEQICRASVRSHITTAARSRPRAPHISARASPEASRRHRRLGESGGSA